MYLSTVPQKQHRFWFYLERGVLLASAASILYNIFAPRKS